MGALLPCASWTSRIICASAVSAPTLCASNLSRPCLLIVAPITRSPSPLSIGILSPVSILSSTAELPSIITPSTGILSPGRTITTSPTTTRSMGMSLSSPLRTTRAVFTCSPINFLIAAPVRSFARTSNSLPSLMRVIMTAEVSK